MHGCIVPEAADYRCLKAIDVSGPRARPVPGRALGEIAICHIAPVGTHFTNIYLTTCSIPLRLFAKNPHHHYKRICLI